MAAATATELATIPRAAERITAEPGISLASLAPGRAAVIVDVERGTPEGQRLRDLGFVPDTRIAALTRAPLGDPTVFDLRGYRLCLRRTEAERVRVRPV
jgi:Fe2+ transport system protein FeoA